MAIPTFPHFSEKFGWTPCKTVKIADNTRQTEDDTQHTEFDQ